MVFHIAAVHTLDLAARNRYRVAAGTGGYGICFCTGIRFRASLCRDRQNAHKHIYSNVIAIPCTAAVDDARGSDRIQCDRIAISIAGPGFPAGNIAARSDRIQCDRIAISIAGLGFPAGNISAHRGQVDFIIVCILCPRDFHRIVIGIAVPRITARNSKDAILLLRSIGNLHGIAAGIKGRCTTKARHIAAIDTGTGSGRIR